MLWSRKIQNRCSGLVSAFPVSGDSRSQTPSILWFLPSSNVAPKDRQEPALGWQKEKEQGGPCVGGFMWISHFHSEVIQNKAKTHRCRQQNGDHQRGGGMGRTKKVIG